MPKYDLSTYCPLPFTGYDSRLNWVCCLYNTTLSDPTAPVIGSYSQAQADARVIQIKQDLISGGKPAECQSCWDNENSGMPSLRTKMTPSNRSVSEIEHEIEHPRLKYIWVDSGSVCNLACRICGYQYSSSLFKEYKDRYHTLPPIRDNADYITKTRVDDLLNEDLSQVRQINVIGGEPFLNLDHVQILDKIVEQGNSKNAKLNYSINGTVKIPPDIERQIEKFGEIKFHVSIDAVGPQFEYCRTNGIWADIEPNLNYLMDLKRRHPSMNIDLHATIGALNVLYLDELMIWAKQFEFNNINQWPLSNPGEYSFEIFSDVQRQYIIDHLGTLPHDFNGLANYIKNVKFAPASLLKFQEEIVWTRQYKGLALRDYLPRLVDLLKM